MPSACWPTRCERSATSAEPGGASFPGRQALLVVAYLRKGETHAGAGDRGRQAQGVRDPRRHLLRIDRVGMALGYDRAFYSGKHKAHGLNVQVIADPIGRLVWISPPLPGARHDMGAAREHRILGALTAHQIAAAADTAYQGAGPTVTVPQRRRRRDPETGRYRRLSKNQKAVNSAHASRRGPGERINAELKNWRVLRKIRSSPSNAATLIAAVQTLMIANA